MPIGCGILRRGAEGGGVGAGLLGDVTRGMPRALVGGRGWATWAGGEVDCRRRERGAGLIQALKAEWGRQSRVACGVGTRPGDYGAGRVATPGGESEGWPGWARALSPPEPARQRGLATGSEVSGVGAEPGGVRRWHATWRLRSVEDCDPALRSGSGSGAGEAWVLGERRSRSSGRRGGRLCWGARLRWGLAPGGQGWRGAGRLHWSPRSSCPSGSLTPWDSYLLNRPGVHPNAPRLLVKGR